MTRNVLVVSNNCFSKSGNNGKTLESILSGFSSQNISQLYFTDKFSPDFDFCKKYFRILDIDIVNAILQLQRKAGTVIEPQMVKSNLFVKSRKKSTFFTSSFLHSFLRLSRDVLWRSDVWKQIELKEWCANQKPDFIFFVGGPSEFSHRVAFFLTKFLNVPLIAFFTDDYLIYPQKRNLFDFIQRYRMKYFYRNTVNKSILCFAIGDLMCETYTTYFGKSFFPIMNSVTIEEYKSKTDRKDEIIVNYFGSIHTNRWKMILKLAKLLENIDKKHIVLSVYSEEEPDRKLLKLFLKGGVNFKGGVFGENLRKTILESDILLHVESDDKNSVSRTKLSISTKIPEYLISGRPILGFGPREIASMRYLTDNKIGIVISPSDENTEISNQIERLFNDKQFREGMGKFAYDFAVKNFDNRKIISDFNMKIERVLNTKTPE